MDQAIGYLGTHIEYELDKAGHKQTKDERKSQNARESRLKVILNPAGSETKAAPKKFADPADLFK